MKLEEVRVRGFRNIKDSGWVNLHDDVTTLVGKNESGKTSFLEAIGRLSDTDEIADDDINNQMQDMDESFPVVQAKLSGRADSTHEIVRPSGGTVYKRKDGHLRVTGNMGVDNTDIVMWEDAIRWVEDTIGTSHKKVQERDPLAHFDKSNIPSGFNQFTNVPDVEEITKSMDSIINSTKMSGIEAEINNFQKFLTEEQPEVISVNNILPEFSYSTDINTIPDSCRRKTLNNKENTLFRRLLDLGDIDYTRHHTLDNPEQTRKRRRAQEKIQQRLNQFWDQKSVEVEIDYVSGDDEFLMMIQDTGLPDKDPEATHRVDRSLIRPSNRSRGFQWFLSFFVSQVTRENGIDESGNTVYLIDDPAVYLHPEGKKNWLDTIGDLTDDAQFLYSSHSPFLIDETHPERIRIVEDRPENRTQITDSIFQGNRETLKPLRNALGIGLGDSPFTNCQKILVEGPSDYFILSGVLDYFDKHEDSEPLSSNDLTLFPVDGADEMPEAGRWMHSEEFAFVFLLDHDSKGIEVEEDIKDDELLNTNLLFFLDHKRAKNSYNVEIEDMFHPEFYLECVNEVYSRDEFCCNIEDGDNEIDDLDLDRIEITEADDGWIVGDGEEYKGMKIVSKIESEFDNQGYASLELDKLRVAKEIKKRLERGDRFREEDVEAFKQVLGPMNDVLYTS